ncbi:MAG: NADH-quinone oxidoreductase subunit H, partial [Leptospiraceae bacterium]|nr:NADH-quinone oxidoreductase subunit H [Leptospiraceae bacterium]
RGLGDVYKRQAQGRKGPPLLQPIYDILRAFQKKPIDGYFSGHFAELSPWVMAFVSVLIWSIVVFEWIPFIVLPFLLMLQRLSITGFAMETGTSFGGLGTSREILISLAAEPILILIILTAQSHIVVDDTWVGLGFGFLFLGATFVVVLGELLKPPFDDPRTHLELTMVHEAMLLEASGRSLALFDFAYQLKLSSFLVFLMKLALEHSKFFSSQKAYVNDILAFCGAILMCIGIGFWESFSVRRKWKYVPEIMGLTYLFILVLGTLVKL